MSAKHTKGPWSQNQYGNVTDPSGETIVAQGIGLAGEKYGDVIGNTNLITAAPELLEALTQAIEWDSHDDEGYPAVWLEAAEAACEKAKGQLL